MASIHRDVAPCPSATDEGSQEPGQYHPSIQGTKEEGPKSLGGRNLAEETWEQSERGIDSVHPVATDCFTECARDRIECDTNKLDTVRTDIPGNITETLHANATPASVNCARRGAFF